MTKKIEWTKEKIKKLKELRSQNYTVKDIALVFRMSYKAVATAIERYNIKGMARPSDPPESQHIDDETLIELAVKRGYIVEKPKKLRGERKIEIDLDRFEGEDFEVGLVADTQMGSKYQQLTFLHDAYAYFEKRKIHTVFHMGDVFDGWTVYRGHIHEVFKIGNDQQLNYGIKNYPKRKGIKTYVIGGQHDYVFHKDREFDILKHLANARDDIEFLGYFGGYIKIGKKLHYLHHPGGGIAYARSYKTQKAIENFAPELKPHFLYRGHHHVYCQMLYRNVVAIDMPCFQSQTPYLREKGYNPELGFVILRFRVNDVGIKNNLAMYEIEHFVFFIPKENDY